MIPIWMKVQISTSTWFQVLFTDFGTLFVFVVGPLLPLYVIFFTSMANINKMAKNHVEVRFGFLKCRIGGFGCGFGLKWLKLAKMTQF